MVAWGALVLSQSQRTRGSKVERAKALKSVNDLSTDAGATLRSWLEFEEDGVELTRTIEGLQEEDEFAVMCRLMGTCTSILAIGQRPIIKSRYIAPDFLGQFAPTARLIPGLGEPTPRWFLIEVKSTIETEFRIKGGLLARRRKLAESLGFPLLFAVRFTRIKGNALWVIVADDDRSKTSIVVTVNHILTGVSAVLWNDFAFYLSPGIKFTKTYSDRQDSPCEIHGKFGNLVDLCANVDGRSIPLASSSGHLLVNTAFVKALNVDETVLDAEPIDGITRVELTPRSNLGWLSNLVYRFNNVVTDEKGSKLFNSSRIVATSDTDEYSWLIGRDIVEQACREFHFLGLGWFVDSTSHEVHKQRWNQWFGSEDGIATSPE